MSWYDHLNNSFRQSLTTSEHEELSRIDPDHINPYEVVNKSFEYRLALYLSKAYFGKNATNESKQGCRTSQ